MRTYVGPRTDSASLSAYGQTLEFVSNQYRHGKTILAIGASKLILDKAGIATELPSGDPDPGVLLAGVEALDNSAAAFIAAAGKHRHSARETDPPRI